MSGKLPLQEMQVSKPTFRRQSLPGSTTTNPTPNLRPSTPPPLLPLAFLAASLLGLAGFGIAVIVNSNWLVYSDTSYPAIGTVHLMMLAFLSTAALGALHQFTPVITAKKLRSARAGWMTLVVFVSGAWMLPVGFFTNSTVVIGLAGVFLFSGICMALWNLSGPLRSGTKSISGMGIKLSLSFLTITALFGTTYALNENRAWFSLPPHLVLAHALFGLIGFLGISYMAVAEKLWPMFLLSHRQSTKLSKRAVYLTAIGVFITASSIAAGNWLSGGWVSTIPGFIGGVILFAGIITHLSSLGSYIRHKRRHLELLHVFILASALFLVISVVLAVLSILVPTGSVTQSRLIAAFISALAGWLTLAVIGHMHKIVPFISFSLLRTKGVRMNKAGKPLSFGDLYNKNVARITLITSILGASGLTIGLLLALPGLLDISGVLLLLTALFTVTNLAVGPWHARL
ncbi:MAG: hypothetical protein M1483_04410 [Actinobacteria bacterium]|nr:hypothetical protein [Actinomycetota bacterium]MCL6104855.1 hypothetical protein [Actinomycetota bacterium]